MRDDYGDGVELSVSVSKKDLLGTLKENLEKHKKEHEEARKGWNNRVHTQLMDAMANMEKLLDASATNPNNWKRKLTEDVTKLLIPKDWHDEPRSYAEHYEDAIDMLSLSEDDVITLSRTLFKQLIQDRWEWKGIHVRSFAKYSVVE